MVKYDAWIQSDAVPLWTHFDPRTQVLFRDLVLIHHTIMLVEVWTTGICIDGCTLCIFFSAFHLDDGLLSVEGIGKKTLERPCCTT